jgi:transposase
LGGINIEVEIDESKFMHRKYHRGLHFDGTWILGIVERNNPANCVFIPCPNNDRSAASLLPLIVQNVLPGTTIYTDMWRSYNQLETMGFIHGTVNHRGVQ